MEILPEECGRLLQLARRLPMNRKPRWSSGHCRAVQIGLNWSLNAPVVLSKRSEQQNCKAFAEVVHGTVRRLFPEFRYTTIHVNLNFPGFLHIDTKNVGPSVMLVFGENVEGGDLWYNGQSIKTAGRAVMFDGQEPHMTFPYTGERWSVVCYTFVNWKFATQTQFDKLRELGFPGDNLPAKTRRNQTEGQRLEEARRLLGAGVNAGHIPTQMLTMLEKPKSHFQAQVAKGLRPDYVASERRRIRTRKRISPGAPVFDLSLTKEVEKKNERY